MFVIRGIIVFSFLAGAAIFISATSKMDRVHREKENTKNLQDYKYIKTSGGYKISSDHFLSNEKIKKIENVYIESFKNRGREWSVVIIFQDDSNDIAIANGGSGVISGGNAKAITKQNSLSIDVPAWGNIGKSNAENLMLCIIKAHEDYSNGQ